MIQLEITILIAVLTAIIGPLLVTKYRHYLKQKENVDPIAYTIKLNREIDNELEILREELGCCRIWLSQFHNGGNFYPTGKSIQKFSIFFEVTQKGISSIAHTFNNIPTSLYPMAFSHMLNDEQKGIFIPDFKDPKVATYGLKGAADSVGTKSSYLIPLFTLDDKFIGTIGIDYVTKKKRLTKDEWEHFQIKAGRIAGYLSTHLQKS